jgi:hypothetical protein
MHWVESNIYISHTDLHPAESDTSISDSAITYLAQMRACLTQKCAAISHFSRISDKKPQNTKNMATSPYYPTREGDQLTWFLNLTTKIDTFAVPLEINPLRLTQIFEALSWLTWTWGTFLPSRRLDGPAALAWRNLLATGTSGPGTTVTPPLPATLVQPSTTPSFGMLTWLFEEIGRWKSAVGYNDTIGQSLGIIGAVLTPPDLTTLQPIISATASGGSVKVGWGWQGHAAALDLCELMVNRSDGQNFTLLAYDSTPNYEDSQPYPVAPTKWIYKAIYRVADHQVGQWSAVAEVLVGG